MAALPYHKVVASKAFTILVGPHKKTCTIHADLLAAMSGPLNALVNVHMREATEAMAEWPDVDEETFARFGEFAYTGTYGALDEHPATGPSTGDEHIARDHVPTKLRKLKRKKMMRQGLLDPSISADPSHSGDVTNDDGTSTSLSAPIDESAEGAKAPSFTDGILSHARVYVFADCYLVRDLAKLSLKRLHEALETVPKGKEFGGAIAQLADYTFANTVAGEGHQDPLREQLCLYIADNIQTIWPSSDFQSLLEGCGELSKDIIKLLIPRLSPRETVTRWNGWD
ncbi:hypothetical protein F4808DRAFT_408689 [Astrocystis sublimbata]|nr:hypothetical protein F4808DRAFT_408689 [Astrocystis sublimbata]